MQSARSWVPALLAIIWTGLAVWLIVDVATTPDPLGLNGPIITFLLVVWAVGLAVGTGITAVIRRLRTR